jgi:chromosome segregation ATPase
MLQDYSEANAEGKQDMFEEAAERMITAEKALKAKDETIAALRARLAEAETKIESYEFIVENLTPKSLVYQETLTLVKSKLDYLQKLWSKEGVTDGLVDRINEALARKD